MATASTSGPSPRRIFLSYARQDGVTTAQTLRTLLESTHHTVWLDTARISGGASWSKEIEEALNNCEILIAVLTPASYLSEICRAEHIWALDEGKLVIPVLATSDPKVVPLYLKGRNYRKFPAQQSDLLQDLGSESTIQPPPERPLRYDTIPNLPQNHILRESALSDLRNLVFSESTNGNIAVTAMAGMGGIGKTVLATALCRDLAVQRAFPDGIAWITIGREWDCDFVTRMREVAKALGDELSGYENQQACENRYRTILRKKAALVVIDDIWSLEHLKPLLVDAPRSRFLFTTRDTAIAKAVTSRKYSANLLTDAEARDLLSRWSGADPLPPEANEIIRECGDLAAAISQIGATLRDVSSAEWRDTLRALQHADISAVESLLPAGQTSFFKSLAVSFQALSQERQARYLKLAVLLEDVPAPLVVLQTIWATSESETRQTARYLVDRSLAFWQDIADPTFGLRLHDLQLDYVRARFEDQDALSLIHGALRLSAHIVAVEPQQFASQMIGRLLPHRDLTALCEFSAQLAAGGPGHWLKPLWPALHPPGTQLVRTLSGHSNEVTGVALSGDGKRAVSASWDYTLKVWDVESGRELRTLSGHSHWVKGVALSADGKRAVSASEDNTLKVWDVESGLELRTLSGHSDVVFGVALSADGKRALSASRDTTLKVWEVESGLELRTLSGHSAGVTGVALSADGKRALSASSDTTLKVWDVESGLELRTLSGHSNVVTGVALSGDGKRAVSASYDKTLKVWEVESGLEVRPLSGHSGSVSGVALSGDGKRAVSASNDETLKVWDVEGGLELRTLSGHSNWVNGVALSADGKRAVSASIDETLKVWDVESGLEVRTLSGHSGWVRGVALSADGKRAVSASNDKTLKVWEVESGLEVRTLSGHSGSVSGVALSGDGKRAVSASNDETLKVWDVESGREVRTLSGHSASVNGVALSADGKRAISASEDKTAKIWDADTGACIATFHCDAPPTSCAWVDGSRILVGDSSGHLHLLSLEGA